MKLLNNCFILLIFCGVFQKSHGTILNCEFRDLHFYPDKTVYSCIVSTLDNTDNTMVITGSSGIHESNRNDNDVRGIFIDSTNTKFFPKNLGLLFKNITVFNLYNSQLVEIKSQYFMGMQDLEYLYLGNNKLSSIPIDSFSTLTKLKVLGFIDNQIEEIPNGVFSNNLQLEILYLYSNNIKFLGSNIFNELTKLNYVMLKENVCISQNYDGFEAIIQLKNDIKMQCKNPNEVFPPTITQSPLLC